MRLIECGLTRIVVLSFLKFAVICGVAISVVGCANTMDPNPVWRLSEQWCKSQISTIRFGCRAENRHFDCFEEKLRY